MIELGFFFQRGNDVVVNTVDHSPVRDGQHSLNHTITTTTNPRHILTRQTELL